MSGGDESAHVDTGGTALFVRRPILALVFNTLIVVAGLAAYFGIEVRELPQVDQPVITVRTTFAGASPETVDREVTEIVEGAVARVSGLKSLSSQSSFGSSRVTVHTRARWAGCLTRAWLPTARGPSSSRVISVMVGVRSGHCSTSRVKAHTVSPGAAMSISFSSRMPRR